MNTVPRYYYYIVQYSLVPVVVVQSTATGVLDLVLLVLLIPTNTRG